MWFRRNLFDSFEFINGKSTFVRFKTINEHRTEDFINVSTNKSEPLLMNSYKNFKGFDNDIFVRKLLRAIDVNSYCDQENLERFVDHKNTIKINLLDDELQPGDPTNKEMNINVVRNIQTTASITDQIDSIKQRRIIRHMPSALIDKMTENQYLTPFKDSSKSCVRPPRSIEISPQLNHLKFSNIVTKQNLRELSYITDTIDSRKRSRPKKEKDRCFMINDFRDKVKQESRISVGLKIYRLKVYDQSEKDHVLLRDLAKYLDCSLEYFLSRHITSINVLEIPYPDFAVFCKTGHTIQEVYLSDSEDEDGIVSLVEINASLRDLIDTAFPLTNIHVNSDSVSRRPSSPNINSNSPLMTLQSLQMSSRSEASDRRKLGRSTLDSRSSTSRRKQILKPRLHGTPQKHLEDVTKSHKHQLEISTMLANLNALSLASIEEIKKGSPGITVDGSDWLTKSAYASAVTKERDAVHRLYAAMVRILEHLSQGSMYDLLSDHYTAAIKSKLDRIISGVIDFETRAVGWIGRFCGNDPGSHTGGTFASEAGALMCYSLHICELVHDFSRQNHRLPSPAGGQPKAGTITKGAVESLGRGDS